MQLPLLEKSNGIPSTFLDMIQLSKCAKYGNEQKIKQKETNSFVPFLGESTARQFFNSFISPLTLNHRSLKY